MPNLLNRTIRYVNWAIGAALLLILSAVYWYVWRPLPKISGSVPAFLGAKVTAARDALGVPHIVAANLDDALFVQGYVTAQDRLWQMDSLRRLAAGDLAEIIGPAALEADKEARRLRLRRIAENAYTTLSPNDREVLAAYARGVNFFIETHQNDLPVEFTVLGYSPRPWSVVDSILVSLQMFRDLTTTWKFEIAKRMMLLHGDPAKVNFLFPVRTGPEPAPGSNAWVLAGSRTATGHPLLSNDPHLEWSIPDIWYMIQIRTPDWNVAGVSLPGIPGVVIGHNDRIAWGITNLQYDVQDLYLEKIDENTGRYLFRGNVEQARADREVIPVKDSTPVEMLVWVTRHGPLFLADGRERMALRWVAADPGDYQFPIIDIDRARNWREFTAALARFPGPGSNFVYADVDGNIGYHAAGKLPIRKTYDGDVPVDGSSGNFEWQGYIPFDQLPSFYDPAQGMIVTANQNPFPPDYPYRVNGNFAPYYRAKQIRDLLSARTNWHAEDLLTVQKDVYSGFSRYLARTIVTAWDREKLHERKLEEPIALLRSWNGQMDKDEAAPLIAELAYHHFRRIVAECASPRDGSAYDFPIAPAVIEKLLRTRPEGWFNDWDETLLHALSDGVEEGTRMQGSNVRKWKYGYYLRLLIRQPVGHHLPLVAPYFDIGPVPMSGSSTTVKQTTFKLGPSMRMNVDLGNWDRSWLNITTGQSGQILSSHYKDQWEHYYSAHSYPMHFRNVNAKDVLTFVPQH